MGSALLTSRCSFARERDKERVLVSVAGYPSCAMGEDGAV